MDDDEKERLKKSNKDFYKSANVEELKNIKNYSKFISNLTYPIHNTLTVIKRGEGYDEILADILKAVLVMNTDQLDYAFIIWNKVNEKLEGLDRNINKV